MKQGGGGALPPGNHQSRVRVIGKAGNQDGEVDLCVSRIFVGYGCMSENEESVLEPCRLGHRSRNRYINKVGRGLREWT